MEVLSVVFSVWLLIQLGILFFGCAGLHMTLKENKECLAEYSKPTQVMVYTVPWLINKIWG
ncbi:hypothetical protein SIPHO082v1_p0091 [Vibrio phage 294E48.1]|nr:hypothetical protein SIPHO082v1_p0091 [Vibrio phage 294E48.1]